MHSTKRIQLQTTTYCSYPLSGAIKSSLKSFIVRINRGWAWTASSVLLQPTQRRYKIDIKSYITEFKAFKKVQGWKFTLKYLFFTFLHSFQFVVKLLSNFTFSGYFFFPNQQKMSNRCIEFNSIFSPPNSN